MDLFVWFNDADEIISYQLTYHKPHDEKALIWNEDRGFSHLAVDEGVRPGKYPASPLLVKDGDAGFSRIVALLKKNSGELDASINSFIVSGIEQRFK
ncbi:MAG: hypothetical protein ACI9LO_003397 [Planctomycetota bacterium]|jgi:hypothetical protein